MEHKLATKTQADGRPLTKVLFDLISLVAVVAMMFGFSAAACTPVLLVEEAETADVVLVMVVVLIVVVVLAAAAAAPVVVVVVILSAPEVTTQPPELTFPLSLPLVSDIDEVVEFKDNVLVFSLAVVTGVSI